MRIVSPIQPLIFSFKNIDLMLDGLKFLKNETLSVSLYKNTYYISVFCRFKTRTYILKILEEFGKYVGLGIVLDAFIAEHGISILSKKLINS